MDFGSSGSGVVREIKSRDSPYEVNEYGEEVEKGTRFIRKEENIITFSFFTSELPTSTAPLSLSKGCDYAVSLGRSPLDVTQITSPLLDYAYRGLDTENLL